MIRRTLQEAFDLYASQAIAHAKPRRFLIIFLVAFDGRAKGLLAKYELAWGSTRIVQDNCPVDPAQILMQRPDFQPPFQSQA